MEICSIGFTRRSAEGFFESLRQAEIRKLIDIRLNNTSQLAGFAKRDDLKYFLDRLLAVQYVHEPLLAPTQEMLDDLKKRGGTWRQYEEGFLALMEERQIDKTFSREFFVPKSVLLCSEFEPDDCHRRLVIEFLAHKWGEITAVHL